MLKILKNCVNIYNKEKEREISIFILNIKKLK